MHRTYHVSRVPTFNRKVRVIADWTLALFFRREIVSLGALQNPREEFETRDETGVTAGEKAPRRQRSRKRGRLPGESRREEADPRPRRPRSLSRRPP